MTNKSTVAAAASLLGRCGTVWSRFSVVMVGLGLCAGLLETGCKVRPNNQSVRIVRKATAPTSPAAVTTPVATAPVAASPGAAEDKRGLPFSDQRYTKFVRPLLDHMGCSGGTCHGMMRGGGFYLQFEQGNEVRNYRVISERLDRKNPENSLLIQKAIGKVPHNGGHNLDEKSCDYKRLIAWIGERPEVDCKEEVPDTKARFVREVAPALTAAGCSTASCHGGDAKAQTRFNLASLLTTPPGLSEAYIAFSVTRPNNHSPWMGTVVKALNASDGIHKQAFDPMSCVYRRIYSYVALSPEVTCDLAETRIDKRLPSLPDFARIVLPAVVKRGCTDSSCHGGGAGDMTLFEGELGSSAVLHTYLTLLARVEDLAHPEQSLLLRTARNEEPHGGGHRLGGKGDCVDSTVVTWLRARPITVCPPPKPPSYERFVKEVQPVMDKMTCTNPKCHGGLVPNFLLIKQPTDEKGLRKNYESTIRHIDFDYMPFSGIQLRMREPCAYSVVGAWIEGTPHPTCVVHDPDPSIFPRRDGEGNIMHPKVEPGPPTPATPASTSTTTKT